MRLQIAVANGEKLPFTQEDLTVHGAAIECRIYAEDPTEVPAVAGEDRAVAASRSGPYVRDDSGVYEGSEISVFYDPMISKLITWGATRAEAIERMERALMEYRVGGIKTNLAFHRRVMKNASFTQGATTPRSSRREGRAAGAAHRRTRAAIRYSNQARKDIATSFC